MILTGGGFQVPHPLVTETLDILIETRHSLFLEFTLQFTFSDPVNRALSHRWRTSSYQVRGILPIISMIKEGPHVAC